MGHSIAIAFTVDMTTRGGSGKLYECTPAQWRVKSRTNAPGYGKPNAANLAAYVARFEESTLAGGCNAHLGVQVVVSAKIVDQRSRDSVASYSV